MATRRRAIAVAAMLGVLFTAGGCAELKEDIRLVRDLLSKLRGREPAPKPPSPPPTAEMPASAAAGLTLEGNCVAKDETGYAEDVRLDVAGGQFRRLDARIDIPGRGSCSYRLADFRQTRRTPYVELMALSDTACALRMWQQGDRITLAATDCEEKCSRGAFEFTWPVVFNTAGGCY